MKICFDDLATVLFYPTQIILGQFLQFLTVTGVFNPSRIFFLPLRMEGTDQQQQQQQQQTKV